MADYSKGAHHSAEYPRLSDCVESNFNEACLRTDINEIKPIKFNFNYTNPDDGSVRMDNECICVVGTRISNY
ncbi:MAG: hypothetical protein M3Y53_07870 [Thermoproteota archaeon]|nr:hypothetical protein [Thermoproteota archaeon]